MEEGRIELMQNRRLFKDDGRGVEEALNEFNIYGYSLTTQNSYRLNFIERDTELSQQRSEQLVMEEPLQSFFAVNWLTTD